MSRELIKIDVEPSAAESSEICKWDWYEYTIIRSLYNTDCNKIGKLFDNDTGFKYCPYCGKEIFFREYLGHLPKRHTKIAK